MSDVRKLMTLLLLILLALPALAGEELDNSEGEWDGLYRGCKVKNKTDGTVTEGLEVDVEGKWATIRYPSGPVETRIDIIYDWGYQTEITAHLKNGKDVYIIYVPRGLKSGVGGSRR
ncbi:MAG TPA: hypothetical protein VNO81_06750 [Candidatus Nitrosotenuis sp.]|nr:hypothetical protein [Candidatus Nitrosotenuis sp.]